MIISRLLTKDKILRGPKEREMKKVKTSIYQKDWDRMNEVENKYLWLFRLP